MHQSHAWDTRLFFRSSRSYALAAITLWATACGDDQQPDGGPEDAGGTPTRDAGPTGRDAAASDAATRDAASADAAPADAAPADAGAGPDIDASGDAAVSDASSPEDAGVDAAVPDAASADAGDAGGQTDAGPVDSGLPDSGLPDSGPPDSGQPDAGHGTGPDAGGDAGTSEPSFTKRVVTSGLASPWEVTWGPDNQLWITERAGKRVIRVDPANGARTTALTVGDAYQASGQDGVLGLALHPRLLKNEGTDYVYLAYTYDADSGNAVDRRAKIVRFTYDEPSESLGGPLELITGLSASDDHNAGRLAFGPDYKLYYTIGDQGHNQFQNTCQAIHAQELPTHADVNASDWSKYQGKLLRLALDGTIPSDNPLLAGVRSHVYTYGHRNAQGIVFGPDGKLYASEQGPKTDDELNLIVAGKNYGWPEVAGFQDDKAYVYGNWSASSPVACSTLTFSDYVIPPSVPVQRESAWSHPVFTPPLKTFYTVGDGFDFTDPACAGNEFICWPTIAPPSLDLYQPGSSGVQSWGNSLLLTSLKEGTVFRVGLSADGQTTVGEASALFKTTNRYRDVAIAADKRTFYVITDSDGATSGPTSGSTVQLDNRGAILEFRAAP